MSDEAAGFSDVREAFAQGPAPRWNAETGIEFRDGMVRVRKSEFAVELGPSTTLRFESGPTRRHRVRVHRTPAYSETTRFVTAVGPGRISGYRHDHNVRNRLEVGHPGHQIRSKGLAMFDVFEESPSLCTQPRGSEDGNYRTSTD